MDNLIAMTAAAAASLAYYWRFLAHGRDPATRVETSSRGWVGVAHHLLRGFGFLTLYSLTLLLALRFGARVDPGTWVPGSPALNELFNGGLIWFVGYAAVAFAACTSTALLVFHEAAGACRSLTAIARTLSWLAIGLAILLSLYGFYLAVVWQRLPA